MSQYNITRQEAIDLTTDYRSAFGENAKRAFKIDKAEIDQVFEDNPIAEGVRVYMGGSSADEFRLVMVATDAEGNDILDSFYDHMSPCPSDCDTGSVLNNGE